MRKETYETPYMDRVQVVMENGIMKASLGDDPTDTRNGLSIQDQDPGVAIGGSGAGWNVGNDGDKWDVNNWD